mgnify:CR=1 FL=1
MDLCDIGGLSVNPGDLLHGDRNGVTTIPLEVASEVVDLVAEFDDGARLVVPTYPASFA